MLESTPKFLSLITASLNPDGFLIQYFAQNKVCFLFISTLLFIGLKNFFLHEVYLPVTHPIEIQPSNKILILSSSVDHTWAGLFSSSVPGLPLLSP
jgi:hypothetical protein